MVNKNETIEQKIIDILLKDIADGVICGDIQLERRLIILLKDNLKFDEEWQIEYPKERILKVIKKEKVKFVDKIGQELEPSDKTQKALKSFAIFVMILGGYRLVAGIVYVLMNIQNKDVAQALQLSINDSAITAICGAVVLWLGYEINKNLIDSKIYLITMIVFSGIFIIIKLLILGKFAIWLLILFLGSFFGLSLCNQIKKGLQTKSG